jgi:hypothetical protein
MDSQAAAIAVIQSLDNTPAVVDVDVSVPNRTVHVVMGDLEGETSVRRHLSSAGYPPED